jgi:hypothetical protein
LPTLRRLFEDWGETVCDIACLIGPEAGPLLPELLDAVAQDDYWDLQWAAADAIGSVASASPETLTALRNALAHDSGIVRSAACNAFSRIGEPAVVTLLEWFEAEADPKSREWIAAALSRMGPIARSAVPPCDPNCKATHTASVSGRNRSSRNRKRSPSAVGAYGNIGKQ